MHLKKIERLIGDLELLLASSFLPSVKHNKMHTAYSLTHFDYSVLLKDTNQKVLGDQDAMMTTVNFYEKPSGYTSISGDFAMGLVYGLNSHHLLAKFSHLETFISSTLSLKESIATFINDFNTYFYLESLNKLEPCESKVISIIRSRKCFLYIEMNRKGNIQSSIVIKELLYNSTKPCYENDDLSFAQSMKKGKSTIIDSMPEIVFSKNDKGYDGNIFGLMPRFNDYHELIRDDKARYRYISLKEIENL